jgi:hypothetical protein
LRSSAGLSSPANPASTHAEYPPPMLTIFLNPCVYIFAYYARCHRLILDTSNIAEKRLRHFLIA